MLCFGDLVELVREAGRSTAAVTLQKNAHHGFDLLKIVLGPNEFTQFEEFHLNVKIHARVRTPKNFQLAPGCAEVTL